MLAGCTVSQQDNLRLSKLELLLGTGGRCGLADVALRDVHALSQQCRLAAVALCLHSMVVAQTLPTQHGGGSRGSSGPSHRLNTTCQTMLYHSRLCPCNIRSRPSS